MSKKRKTLDELWEEALVPEEEQPYEIPENWVWTRFGRVAKVKNGYAFKSKDFTSEGIPVIRISDINNHVVSTEHAVKVPMNLYNESYKIEKGDLLIAMSGATTGKTGIYDSDEIALQNQRIGNIKVLNDQLLDRQYKNYFIMHMSPKILEKAYGGAQPNISAKDIESFVFPLPPLNEQKRIVEKIECLFSKIDKAKQLLEEAKETFELRRAAILDKAFRGLFGTNNREDESLSDQFEKNEIMNGLYEVPDNWVWVRLKRSLKSIQYGYTESSSHQEIGPKFLRITDIQDDKVDWDSVPYCKISEEDYEKYKLEDHDIVVARTGATTGKSYLINKPPSSVFASYLIRLQCDEKINPRYLWNYMKSPSYWKQITVVKKGSAQPGANAKILGNLLVPIPPLDEQMRISNEVEKMLVKFEKEKELLDDILLQLEVIKQSVLFKAFRGELGTNDAVEESAIELLKMFFKNN